MTGDQQLDPAGLAGEAGPAAEPDGAGVAGEGTAGPAGGAVDDVEAVIFDWGGTLTPWHTIDFAKAWRAVAEVADQARVDVHGAKQVGMRAVHIPHSDIPDHQRGHIDGAPDAVVQSLAELVPLVDAWRAAATTFGAGRPR